MQFGCPHLGDPVGPCSEGTWYSTADGRFLLFDGQAGLERYDSVSRSTTLIAAGGIEISSIPKVIGAAFARSAVSRVADGPVRAMSDNGEYVFFDSGLPLVPQASNGTLDAYEWHDGRISLLGSGSDPTPTFFLGYSPYEYTSAGGEKRRVEAGEVFIGTHAKLVAADTNSMGDIYSVRVCESQSPCIKPPVGETAQCEGGSCQTVPSTGVFQAPGTLTLQSSGNLAPPAAASVVAVKAHTPTRAQLLARALKACRKDRQRKKRLACERQARRRYGPAKKASRASRTSRGGRQR